MSTRRPPDTPVASLGEGLRQLPTTLLGHCPECGTGQLFKNYFQLKDTCEVCHVRFERDAGSSMIAMVLNYFISLILTGILALVLIFRFGFFSGVMVALAGFAVLSIFVLYRFTKLLHLWLLWLFGFVYPDTANRGKKTQSS